MSLDPLARGGEPTVDQLYALLAGITQAAEGEIRVPDRALLAASGKALHIFRDEGRECIVLRMAPDVPTGAGSGAQVVEAWEDTFVGGVPPELGPSSPRRPRPRRRR